MVARGGGPPTVRARADRDLLERYLASLHRELAGSTRDLRGSIGELSTFLLAIRAR